MSHQGHEARAEYSLTLDYESRGESEKAERSLWKAVALQPDYPEACYELARLLSARMAWPEAEEAFRHLIQLVPNFNQAHVELGLVLSALGRRTEATKEFVTAVDADPKDPFGLTNLAMARRESGQLLEARMLFERALEQAPCMEEAVQGLAGVLVEERDLAGAEAVLLAGESSGMRPTQLARVQLSLGCLMGQQGRMREAVIWLRKACATDPANTHAKTALDEAVASEPGYREQ